MKYLARFAVLILYVLCILFAIVCMPIIFVCTFLPYYIVVLPLYLGVMYMIYGNDFYSKLPTDYFDFLYDFVIEKLFDEITSFGNWVEENFS